FAAPMMPRPPAFDTAATSGAMETPPMPARQIGTSIPNRSQIGVRRGERGGPFDAGGCCMGRTFDAAPGTVKARASPMDTPLPVLLGVGQITDRPDDPRDGLEPLALM